MSWSVVLGTVILAVLVSVVTGVVIVLAGARYAHARGTHPPEADSIGVRAASALPAMNPDELAHLRGELSAVRAEWKAHQKQLDAYLEAFEDIEETVERKRRRAATSRSRVEHIEASGNGEVDPNSRDAIRARARARGFRV